MKKKLDTVTMESINGGNAADSFCNGFTAVATTYAVGVAANWWNPVGWVGTAAGLVIETACIVNSLR